MSLLHHHPEPDHATDELARPTVAIPAAGSIATATGTGRAHCRYVRVIKPVLDRMGAFVAVLVFLPVLLAVAATVRWTMGRGVLFRQTRIGRDGVPFTIVKFRTMLADRRTGPSDRRALAAERAAAAGRMSDGAHGRGPDRRRTHKHPHDPRHTRVGRFLRSTSLDELPQLWNVLKGEMSMCGPRPELATVVARYAPWQHRRHLVKPGLTGLWQLSEHRNEPMADYVWMDLQYIDEVSFVTDLRLLARTATSVVRHRGT